MTLLKNEHFEKSGPLYTSWYFPFSAAGSNHMKPVRFDAAASTCLNSGTAACIALGCAI